MLMRVGAILNPRRCRCHRQSSRPETLRVGVQLRLRATFPDERDATPSAPPSPSTRSNSSHAFSAARP